MSSFRFDLLNIILSIPAVMIAFTVQGYAKALVADRLGDKLPRFQGRLTLNPMAHLDPLGFIMILLVRFGWTKPLETNPRAYKRGYKDAIKVSIAAPIGNLIVGFVATLLYVLFQKTLGNILPNNVYIIFSGILWLTAVINTNLFIFNLLPLPGLAGFDILKDLAPKKFYKVADSIYQYQFLILILIILFGSWILTIPSTFLINLFLKFATLIFGVL